MRIALLSILLFAGMSSASSPKEDEQCPSLQACLQQLRAMAMHPGDYESRMSAEESALARRIIAFDGAVDALVPLLADPDGNVANIAAAALRGAKRIDPGYLPQIRKGLDRGLGWLAPALGHIDSDEAAKEAVDRYLVSDSAPENQEKYAVELSGKRAIPFILERAACKSGCDKRTHYLLGSALEDMDDEARGMAAAGLMTIATDAGTSKDTAGQVLLMIADLGEAGHAIEPDLLKLRARSPDLSWAADQALVGIRSTASGAVFAARLRQGPNDIVLRDLAETGPAARDAGSEVVRLLANDDPDIRIATARALGFIGYEPAAGALVGLLNDRIDPRLGRVAAESLGRLHAQVALPALDEAAKSHWYPPVREAASVAARHIRDGSPYESPWGDGNFAFEFFAYQDMGMNGPECAKFAARQIGEPKSSKLYEHESPAALKKLAYMSTILGYGPAEESPVDSKDKVIEVTPDNMVEHRNLVEQVPHVALRVDGGWLVGSDRGEWGGELMFIGDDGVKQLVLDQNVEDIYRLGDKYVATTGLAHLTMNEGDLVELDRDQSGRWNSKIWKVLPGAPRASWLVEGGELLVKTVDGGTILISPDGGMRMATCRRYAKPTGVDRDAERAAEQAQAAADAAAEAADRAVDRDN
jgi:HEAT repeat protein